MDDAKKKLDQLKQQLALLRQQLDKLKSDSGHMDEEALEAAAAELRAKLNALSASITLWDTEAQKLKGQQGVKDEDLQKLRGEAADLKSEIKKLCASVDELAPEAEETHATFSKLADNSGKLIVMIVLAAIVWAVLFEKGVIPKLSDAAFARGLITFIICLGTIGLAFFLAYQAFSLRDGSADGAFRRAREVFTGLMGVLGTIVGFYFGSAEKPGATLQVAVPRIAGTNLITHIAGGSAPYVYTIKSTEKDFAEIHRKTDGWIQEALPKAPAAGSTITVEVADKKDEKAAAKVELPKP